MSQRYKTWVVKIIYNKKHLRKIDVFTLLDKKSNVTTCFIGKAPRFTCLILLVTALGSLTLSCSVSLKEAGKPLR